MSRESLSERAGSGHKMLPTPNPAGMEIDGDSQLLLVGDKRISFLLVGDDRQPWFQAKPLAEVLGYNDTDQAIRNNVRDIHRQSLRSLIDTFGGAISFSNTPVPQTGPPRPPQTVFVDEPGLYSLLMRSSRREAERFQEWVTAVVLPTIRRTGAFVTGPQPPLTPGALTRPPTDYERQQTAEGALRIYDKLVAMDGATPRDRIMFADIARNVMMPLSTLPALAAPREPQAEVNARRMALPISDIFREVTGRSGTKAQLMSLGRLVSRAYSARHGGASPPEVERCIDGTTRMVKAYSPVDDPWIRDFVANSLGM
ncbi:hypothetical protein WJX74_001218 [Apatococcus lobatus]|uniref:Bro-N domain-containing protein n=1 Tax=Apatococcus lobatus TaxID=904363 RepID=A0AAW1SFW8_9CHLO